jgi:hypothetical protein
MESERETDLPSAYLFVTNRGYKRICTATVNVNDIPLVVQECLGDFPYVFHDENENGTKEFYSVIRDFKELFNDVGVDEKQQNDEMETIQWLYTLFLKIRKENLYQYITQIPIHDENIPFHLISRCKILKIVFLSGVITE